MHIIHHVHMQLHSQQHLLLCEVPDIEQRGGNEVTEGQNSVQTATKTTISSHLSGT
jgi:hypothetical protein